MRTFFKFLGATLLVLLVVLIAIPFFFDINKHHARIAELVAQKTGYDLTMGHIDLHTLPTLNITVEDVNLTRGGQEFFLLRVDKIKLNLELMPLLKRKLVVKDFKLDKPFIRYPKGMSLLPELPMKAKKVSATSADNKSKDDTPAWDVKVEAVTIKDGRLELRDGFATTMIDRINAEGEMDELDGPLEADLSFRLDSKGHHLKVKLADAKDFLDKQPTECSLKAARNPWDLHFKSTCSLQDQGVRLQKIHAKLNEIELKGTMNISWKEPKPHIAGSLNVSDIHIERIPVVAMQGVGEMLAGHFTLIPSAYAAESPKLWEVSEDPILDLSSLQSFTSSLELKTGKIIHPKCRIDELVGTLNVKGGEAILDVTDIKLYDGSGKMMLKAAHRLQTPTVNMNVTLEKLNAQKLFKDLADIDYVVGKAFLKMKISAFGNSTKLLVESLNGDGQFSIPQGTILRVQEIASNKLPFKKELGNELPFEKLSGSWVMESAVASSDDLLFISPLLNLSGKGKTNFVEQTLKYNVVMDHIRLLENSKKTKGANIGIIMYGPIADPRYTIDLTHLITNLPDKLQDEVKDAVEKPVKQLERQLNKNLNKLLNF